LSQPRKIVVLAGDGIGPEIVAATRRVLDQVAVFDYEEHLIGGISIDEHGLALHDDVVDACRSCDAVLLGAVGGPKWDELVAVDPGAARPEQGLLGIRKALGLYANLRPVKPSPALIDSSPLKEERTTVPTRWRRSAASPGSHSRPRSSGRWDATRVPG